jgi:beta-N-acetylhexosaminidase
MIRKRKIRLSEMLGVLVVSLSVLYAPHSLLAQQLNDLTPEDERNIDDLVSRMTIEEKIGQMLIVGFQGTEAKEQAEQLVKKYHVGSIILYEGNIKNMRDERISIADLRVPRTVALLSNSLQELASQTRRRIPLLIAVDQENGSALIIEKGITLLPSAMAIGATRSEEYAFQAGRITGEELRAMGIHMDLAPVADINTNKDNDIIGDRAFGGEKDLVTSLSVQFMKGLHTGGVLSIAKHFPGHGDSSTDPHVGLPIVGYDRGHIETVNMYPFKALVEAGVDGIMPAHMEFPALRLRRGLPISLSKSGLEELVRKKLNFEGVLMTDDLVRMRAVHIGRTLKMAARLAAAATNDILMFAHITYGETNSGFAFDLGDLEAIIHELRDYFKGNAEQLDQSVRRILRLKLRVNKRLDPDLWKVDPSRLREIIRTREKLDWGRKISDESITLVNDYHDLFAGGRAPLERMSANEAILAVVPVFRVDDFTPRIRGRGYSGLIPVQLRYGVWGKRAMEDEIKAKADEIVKMSSDVNLILFGMVNKIHARILRDVRERVNKPIVAIAFHEPNLLSPQMIHKLTYLAAYSNLEPSNESVVKVLAGEVRPKPRKFLPVSILPGFFEVRTDGADIIPLGFLWWFNKGKAQLEGKDYRAARGSFIKAKRQAQSKEEEEEAGNYLKKVEEIIIEKERLPNN